MIDYFIQTLASNLIISLLLICVALILQYRKRWALANLAWLLILVKLATPPLFNFPLIEIQSIQAHIMPTGISREDSGSSIHDLQQNEDASLRNSSIAESGHKNPERLIESYKANQGRADNSKGPFRSEWFQYWVQKSGVYLFTFWAAVSLLLGINLWIRIRKFSSAIRFQSELKDPQLARIARFMSSTFGLGYSPDVRVTQANLPPLVWWMGRRPIILIPACALKNRNAIDLRMVIAHELAHLSRRDHWTRWVESIVTVVFWWNPLIWYVCRQLRTTEELACDELVVEKLNTNRNLYASSLLNVAESLANSAIRPPKLASAMSSGGMLEKRLKMIVNRKNKTPKMGSRWGLILAALLLFPLGLVNSQDIAAVKKRLAESVNAGEITKTQAGFMLEALQLSAKMKADNSYLKIKKEYQEKKVGQTKKETKIAKDEHAKGDVEYRLQQAMKKVKQAVAEGKVSKEAAAEKMAALEKEFANWKVASQKKKINADGNKKAEIEKAMRKIELAVKEGQLSKQQALEKYEAVKKQYANSVKPDLKIKADFEKDRQVEMKVQLEKAAEKLRYAVEAGKLNKKDAEAKLRSLEQQYLEKVKQIKKKKPVRKKVSSEYLIQQTAEQLEAAVRAGKIDKQSAQKKMQALKESFNREKERREKADKKEVSSRDMENRKKEFAAFLQELEKAVQDGKISKEGAREKLNAVKNKLFGEDTSKSQKTKVKKQ